MFRADDGLFVNAAMAGAGEAEVLSIPPNTAYDDQVGGGRRRCPGRGPRAVGRRAGPAAVASPAVTTLAERLGYGADDRLLIINCDDLGSCHAANVAVYDSLRFGLATSATLMVPCPWAREAAARYRGEDVGVHLTLNAEWDLYRWGPITRAPSLHDGDGGFPRTIEDVWDHADLDEVRRELRAQIERAILWGFDVSHLDSHMGTLQLRPEFFDVYLDLAVEFGLPLRMSGASTERAVGFPFRRLGRRGGRRLPRPPRHSARAPPGRSLEKVLADLRPGGHRGAPPPRRRHARAAGVRARLGEPRRRPRPHHRTPTTSGPMLDRAGIAAHRLRAPAATSSAPAPDAAHLRSWSVAGSSSRTPGGRIVTCG